MTPEAQKLRDQMERAKADYMVLKRQRQKYQQEADRLFDLQKAADEESARRQDALDEYGLSPAIKKARKEALKRANAKFRAAYKEFARAIHRRDKADEQMQWAADDLLEARMRLEDLGYKVNPMAAKKAKKKPSAKQLAARRKFAAAAKARAKAAKKRNGKTIVKAKRVTIVQMPKKANPRKRNVTSASDLVHVGEAKAATRDGVKGWMVARKFFPRSATPKTARLTSGAMLDLKYGDVWKLKRKGNPKKKATARKRNIQFMTGDGYPMRASWDYDPVRAGEGRTGRADYFSRPHVIGGKKISGAKLRQLVEKKQREAVARAEERLKKARASRDDERIEKAKDHLARTRAKVRAAKTTSGAIKSDKETEKKRTQRRQLAAEKAQRKATTTRLASRSLQRSVPLKRKRRNPNDAAKASYESFQGKTSTKSTSLNFPNGTPANVYKLGSLHSITLADGRTIKPAGKAVWLCADTKGKLHLGTTGERLTNAPKGSLGKVKEVEYITSKPHLGDSKPARYFHQLGEETGEKPTLYSDGNGGLVFKGGAYSITSRGIVN